MPVAAGTSFGTFHTGEVPYVFGTLDPARRPYDATDRAISEQLQEHWLAFMRSGNPNVPGRPIWDPQGPIADRVMVIGDRPGPAMPVSSPDRQRVLLQLARSSGKTGVF